MIQDTRFVRGAEKLGQRIATIRAATGLPDLMGDVQELLLRRTLARFDRQEDPDGNPWVPLQQTTLQRRARAAKSYGTKILRETGQLRASIRVIKGNPDGASYINTGAGFRIGVDDPEQIKKARAHQLGEGRSPIRRFLGIGALDVKAVDGLLRRRATQMGF